MLGIEDYGSDAESGDENTDTTATTSTSTSLLLKLPPPTSKSTLFLPPPKSAAAQPKPKRTKKIAINLPSLPTSADDDNDDDTRPPAKKPRVTPSAGAGKSSLLGMLPAPKRPAPMIEKKKKEERVLGGGGGPGLVFRTSKSSEAPHRLENEDPVDAAGNRGDTEVTEVSAPSTSFLPPSLKQGRPNISLENEGPPSHASAAVLYQKSAAPPVDFFSLGSSTPPARSTPTLSSTFSAPVVSRAPSTSASTFTLTSAPAISIFRPPSPTRDDPYPGYYQLPSGTFAPYEAEYYASYTKKWQEEYDKHIRALEKSQYEPETDGSQNVDMAAEMERARREIKEREDRKALTTGMAGQDEDGEIAMPKMNVKGAKLGSVARSRHQLTTLLTEAYLNRDALEEKIAQGRRNRKEAGNKYGF